MRKMRHTKTYILLGDTHSCKYQIEKRAKNQSKDWERNHEKGSLKKSGRECVCVGGIFSVTCPEIRRNA